MRKLRVFGVRGWRSESPAAPNGSHQTREIVAAGSKAEAARLFDCSLYELNNYGSETGNALEIEIAMSKPRVVFWRPSDSGWDNKAAWREASPNADNGEARGE